MPEMLSIGRFGALTGLTARALRLYDQLDLLRPAMVDFPSGYRYYSPEQVDVARAIGRLRAAQMPLLEVAELLRTDDEATIGSLLDRHRERLRK